MKIIVEKTAEELEFKQILHNVVQHCASESAKEQVKLIQPLTNVDDIRTALSAAHEFLQIETYADGFPSFSGTEIADEIALLKIGNTVLSAGQLANLATVNISVIEVCKYLKKNNEQYPTLFTLISDILLDETIIKEADKILDRSGKIKSSASPELAKIRRELGNIQTSLNREFAKEIARLKADNWLSDTAESFVNGRRVLSVRSEYKRKISGHIMGASNTGKVTYIEPQATITLHNELVILENEELQEMYRIMREVTEKVRPLLWLLEVYQNTILELDVIRAKARFAYTINARKPEVSEEVQLQLVQAYHPLLLLKNKQKGATTLPQTIKLNTQDRLLVISGPNAGGKSITLKTVGLLQLMAQSGLLIPAKEYSKVSVFKNILTDIGDNQSIENELSTYSHRLKQMRSFLSIATKNSLVLIDEFGTGSDPELGGAMAEVFFEELVKKRCFGVITTHYMNIKVMADKSAGVINGSMLFDKQNLSPLFQLKVGQPGSSFTFEVAEKMGIHQKLIARAKRKVEKDKLNLDDSIASLQKEKADLTLLTDSLKRSEKQNAELKKELELSIEEYEDKYASMTDVADIHEDLVKMGKKLRQWVDAFDESEKGEKLFVDRVTQYLKSEKARQNKVFEAMLQPEKPKTKKANKPKTRRVKEEKIVPAKPKPVVVGAKVRWMDSASVGEVTAIEKNKATVIMGRFTSKIGIEQLTVI